jgi:hypothetical protein
MTSERQKQLDAYELERKENRRKQKESPAYAGFLISLPGPTTIKDDETGQVYEKWENPITTLCPSKWYAWVHGEWKQLRPPNGEPLRLPQEIANECRRQIHQRLDDLTNEQMGKIADLLKLPYAYDSTSDSIEATKEVCSYCLEEEGDEHGPSCPCAGLIVGKERQSRDRKRTARRG